MADWYIDNNKTIYATSRSGNISGLTAGQTSSIYLGLPDITDLPGQSTVFVNWVRFEANITVQNGGVGESFGWSIASVLPYDLASAVGAAYPQYVSYLDLKGWPLKNSKRLYWTYSGDTANSANTTRTVYTFRPRKSLKINRNQALYFGLYNEYGQPINGMINMVAQFKRAD